MPTISRRNFLSASAMFAFAGPCLCAAERARQTRWTLDLTPGAIGVSGDALEMIRLAHAHGFDSVQPDSGYMSRQAPDGVARYREVLADSGLKWGSAGLGVEFRRDDATFQRDLESLPRTAAALREAGVTRMGTWLMPGHNDLDYAANLRLHVKRLGEVSRILADHGLRLGIEYVGTPSLRARFKFPFIHRLSEAQELIAKIGVPGTGLVLDSWHWWTAGDRAEDIGKLANADVIAVDLNDAPAGLKVEDQQDNRRELPAATGVIPVGGFLKALAGIGYDGPIRAEPFNDPLNQLDNDAACARTIAALRQATREIDVAAAAGPR